MRKVWWEERAAERRLSERRVAPHSNITLSEPDLALISASGAVTPAKRGDVEREHEAEEPSTWRCDDGVRLGRRAVVEWVGKRVAAHEAAQEATPPSHGR